MVFGDYIHTCGSDTFFKKVEVEGAVYGSFWDGEDYDPDLGPERVFEEDGNTYIDWGSAFGVEIYCKACNQKINDPDEDLIPVSAIQDKTPGQPTEFNQQLELDTSTQTQ